MKYIEYDDAEGHWLIVQGMTLMQADNITMNNPQFPWDWKVVGRQRWPAFKCLTPQERAVFGKHLSCLFR